MPQRLSRRAVLAALATAAGCAGNSGDGENTATTQSTTLVTTTATASTSTTEQSTTTQQTTAEPVEVREWPEEYYSGPLVSAHEHMHGRDGFQMDEEKLEWYKRWMDRNRVDRVVGFSSDRYVYIFEGEDDYVLPFAFPWGEIRQDLDHLADNLAVRLDRYPVYEGLGEFGLKGREAVGDTGSTPLRADHPAMLEVYDLAAERDIPVMIHAARPFQYSDEKRKDFEEPMDIPSWAALEKAYEYNRDTDFLVHSTYEWYKMRDGGIIAGALERNPNLYFDISEMHPYAYGEGQLSQDEFESKFEETSVETHAERFYDAHREILENHSDSVTWGMDASSTWHYTDWALNTWVDVGRACLGMLPEENARNIGYRTAEELFDIEVEDGE